MISERDLLYKENKPHMGASFLTAYLLLLVKRFAKLMVKRQKTGSTPLPKSPGASEDYSTPLYVSP